jgi:hypothetical protein
MVEQQPSKLNTRVRFPSPALHLGSVAAVAQLVEHFLGKEEVMGSSPISSLSFKDRSGDFWCKVFGSGSTRATLAVVYSNFF